MSTDAFGQLIDVAAPGGGSYPVQRGHRRGVRSPHTFDAARWPPSSLTSPYAPQGSTTAVLVLPLDDDLVVVPVGDVPRVGDDVHLELVGLPLPAHPLLHGLAPDHDLFRSLDPDEARHAEQIRVGVVLLDGLDQRPGVLGVLEVHRDLAGPRLARHALTPS